MKNQDPKNSVQNEQFSGKAENKEENSGVNPETKNQEKEKAENIPESGEAKVLTPSESGVMDADTSKDEKSNPEKEDTVPSREKDSVSSGASDTPVETNEKEDTNPSLEKDSVNSGDSDTALETTEGDAADSKAVENNEEKVSERKVVENIDEKAEAEDVSGRPAAREEKEVKEEKEEIKYSLLSKKDLIKILDELISATGKGDISQEVEAIKSAFFVNHKAEIRKKKDEFLADGGLESDFSPGFDEDEAEMRDLLKKYRDRKQEFLKVEEKEKAENLEKKYEIIKEIEALIHNDESINKTFQDFRDLQRRWHDIGVVPQKDLKAMWENYHYHVEKFYDFIKINKELRDLDLRKNLELKIELCEKAEALLLETNLVQAFKTLQKYHEQWREIGPVAKEQRTEIWERFKEATSKINKKHQQYYTDLKDQQRKNLESKTLLCEKAEELLTLELKDHGTWVNKTREILELQKVWKTIGFAPKKDNNRIYARFRAACDKFFERKRAYYAQHLDDQNENLQAKISLCEKAESLKDSTDWKKTSDELIGLQKKWKTIGPVPRKQSDEVWKRFRAACDHFFNNRAKFFANIDTTYQENLVLKEKIIKEILDFKPGEDQKENIRVLNDFQKKWADIGFVPLNKKDEISQKYRDALDSKFDDLNMDDHKKNMLKFRTRVESIQQKPRSDVKLRFEREKLMNKLQQLKSDIGVWENNIGFFASTKKADSMISDFEEKIKNAHEKIKLLEDKISFIDKVAPDL